MKSALPFLLALFVAVTVQAADTNCHLSTFAWEPQPRDLVPYSWRKEQAHYTTNELLSVSLTQELATNWIAIDNPRPSNTIWWKYAENGRAVNADPVHWETGNVFSNVVAVVNWEGVQQRVTMRSVLVGKLTRTYTIREVKEYTTPTNYVYLPLSSGTWLTNETSQ